MISTQLKEKPDAHCQRRRSVQDTTFTFIFWPIFLPDQKAHTTKNGNCLDYCSHGVEEGWGGEAQKKYITYPGGKTYVRQRVLLIGSHAFLSYLPPCSEEEHHGGTFRYIRAIKSIHRKTEKGGRVDLGRSGRKVLRKRVEVCLLGKDVESLSLPPARKTFFRLTS